MGGCRLSMECSKLSKGEIIEGSCLARGQSIFERIARMGWHTLEYIHDGR